MVGGLNAPVIALLPTFYCVPEGRGEVFSRDPAAILRAPPHTPGFGLDPLLRHVSCQPRPQEDAVHRHDVVSCATDDDW